jgi:tRNA dimethylallyltransferase
MEIVSADSRQVYRGLPIGTAQPSKQELARVRHHLVAYVEPTEEYSVQRFVDDARAAIEEIRARGSIPLVVGGTGHYIQALVDGVDVPRVPPNSELRSELERFAASAGVAALHARLAELDPVAAATIPATNTRRVIRAIEVTLATGEPFSVAGRRRRAPIPALRIVLTADREWLYRRSDQRTLAMLAEGWVEEVRALIDAGLDERSPAMSSTGYRQIRAYLRGELSREAMIQQIQWATHAYIRRQYVWLRKQPGYTWFDVTRDTEALHETVAGYLGRA